MLEAYVTGATVVVTLAVLVYSLRCRLGYHPAGDLRMRSGRRAGAVSVTEWECVRCMRTAVVREDKIHLQTLRDLRKQAVTKRRRQGMRVVR